MENIILRKRRLIMNKNLLAESIDKAEISLNSLGYGRHPKNLRIIKTLPDYDIIYVLSGSYTFIINDKAYSVKQFDSVFINPDSTLTLIANEDSRTM